MVEGKLIECTQLTNAHEAVVHWSWLSYWLTKYLLVSNWLQSGHCLWVSNFHIKSERFGFSISTELNTIGLERSNFDCHSNRIGLHSTYSKQCILSCDFCLNFGQATLFIQTPTFKHCFTPSIRFLSIILEFSRSRYDKRS